MANERFWEKVDRSGECWIWTGHTDKDGYGLFHNRSGKKATRAHRFSFELSNGPIPEGMLVLHSCDTPPCVRFTHLFLGTHLINMRDKLAKGRQGVCGPTNPLKGEFSPTAKLTDADVLIIRTRPASLTEMAIRFGVSRGSINDVVQRRTWRHL